MNTKRLSKQKSYTLYPEQFAELQEMFKRTYQNESELVRFCIDYAHAHPEDWPVNPKFAADLADQPPYPGTA